MSDAQPWCHHCDRPLTERDTLRTPPEQVGGMKAVELVCARCLCGPGDDEPDPNDGKEPKGWRP